MLAFGCTSSEEKIEAESSEVPTSNLKIVSEEVLPYALTAIDSVYSVRVQLNSPVTAVAIYKVQLQQGSKTFIDSLIFDLPAGDVVQGELIFPACRVKNKPAPSLNSKLYTIEN